MVLKGGVFIICAGASSVGLKNEPAKMAGLFPEVLLFVPSCHFSPNYWKSIQTKFCHNLGFCMYHIIPKELILQIKHRLTFLDTEIIPAYLKTHCLCGSGTPETVKWIVSFYIARHERLTFILSSAAFREWEIGFDYLPDCRNAAVMQK